MPETPLPKTRVELAAFRGEVVRFLQVCGCAAEQAEDLAQATFLLATQKQVEFAVDASARAWLRRTARWLLVGERRRSRRGPQQAPFDEHAWLDAAEAHFSRLPDGGGAWADALAACVQSLPQREQSALQLFYWDGVSHEQGGAAFGIKANGFKMLLQRVRARLRVCVQRRLS